MLIGFPFIVVYDIYYRGEEGRILSVRGRGLHNHITQLKAHKVGQALLPVPLVASSGIVPVPRGIPLHVGVSMMLAEQLRLQTICSQSV